MRNILTYWLSSIILVASFMWWANASHPEQGQMENVKIIAHQLEDASRNLLSSARQFENYRDRYAIEHIEQFAQATKHFHRIIENNFNSPEHTEADYQTLTRSYYDTSTTLYRVNAYRFSYEFRNQWNLCQNLINQLMEYYGGHGDPGHGYDDRRNNDHHRRYIPTPAINASVFTEVGGSWNDLVLRLRGTISGYGVVSAGVYVDGMLSNTISVNSNAALNSFEVRLTWRRWSNRSRIVEVRAQTRTGQVLTLWSQRY